MVRISALPRAALWSVIAGGLVMSAAMGVRQTFGLFIGPFSTDHGLPVSAIAFAVALHNLVWGFAQPLAGSAADRYGTTAIVAFGAILFAAGLALAAGAASEPMFILSFGILVGVGISCTTFGVVLPAVGRAVPPQCRSMAMGLASAGGSLGQMLIVPFAQGLANDGGAARALWALAGVMLIAVPLGIVLNGGSTATRRPTPDRSLEETLTGALRHRGYGLLTLGFFTCGFQLAFIGTHLPNYLSLCHMPAGLGATALSLIGFFNMIGCWACGWMGGRYRQQYLLGALYLLRALAIAAFFLLPKSESSVLLFAAVMGLAWLGTVPLTSGLVAKLFGLEYLGTLFGICFLSHQIGSFLGAWLGGYLFDVTGSYAIVWSGTAIAGVVAAVLHFAIDDAPAAVLASVRG